ncbi:MAG: serine/threonine protein kinase, partial [Gemmatimonadota bacterium]|nr:serine/threonine protein kinase [Gemmatimonadota bacterium]
MGEITTALRAALADRYDLVRMVGQGGMATVYLAQDLKHERDVALKVLRPDLAASIGTQRFLKEIAIAARLSHPHIVALHDSGESQGFLYYVMPYVDGESLRALLRRSAPLPLGVVLGITRQVADALGYAHRMGVLHRDIKPENILLAQGHAFVVDFGIAKAVSTAGGPPTTRTGFALGTPGYMSPEQAAGVRHIDE